MDAQQRTRYTFGPLEQRGLIGSLRPAQTLVLGIALLTIVVVLAGHHGADGMAVAAVVATAALVTVFARARGRALEAWIPILGRFVARRATGRLDYRSRAPTAGVLRSRTGETAQPLSLPEDWHVV